MKLELAKRKVVFFLIPFIIFIYFIFEGITLPYVGPNATNFNVYSLIAHNYNKFGYLPTKFGSVISVSQTLPQKPEYFLHHPPLLSIIESVLFKILGEGFWVGRLTVIFFSFGSLLLTFLIGKILFSTKYSLISLLVMSAIPASSIFGKMIGQEPLVLFFALFTLYLALKYIKTNKKIFLLLASGVVILGTLSDWPIIYFTVFLIPLFMRNKKTKAGLLLLVVSTVVAACLLMWIYWIRSGFWDMQNAIALRSFHGLLDLPFWPIRWVGAMLLRFVVYFNPIFVILSGIYIYGLYKKHKARRLSNGDAAISGLLAFGFFHILLYMQAFFTHPYLLYYLLPFITFGSSLVILKLLTKERYMYVFLIFCFSLLFLLVISDSKKRQIESNIWRYELAYKVSQYLEPYESIIINRSYAIDPDLWWYPFLVNYEVADKNKQFNANNYKHYVYSCTGTCVANEDELKILKENRYIRINSSEAEIFIFSLQEKQTQDRILHREEIKKTQAVMQLDRKNIILDLYRLLRDILKVPQI